MAPAHATPRPRRRAPRLLPHSAVPAQSIDRIERG